VEDGLRYMFWMFELMFLMFILMFSDAQRLKNELELEQQKQEIILKLEEIMRQYDNFEKRDELKNNTPYVIPEIRPAHNDEKKVDK
jgi:hypothetical protein